MMVFVEVARAGGFRAAAERLKLGAGSVSDAVQRLEDRLGVRLFERTTRRVALTGAGERLFADALPAITDLENAVRDLNEREHVASGTLKLSAPRSSGPLFLDKLMAQYAAAYPDVQVELDYDDRKVDLVASGVDAVVRSRALLEQDSHAVPIGPTLPTAIVASSSYLDGTGIPQSPANVTEHDGICFAIDGSARLVPWNFVTDGAEYTVMPKLRIAVNDLLSVLRYAEAGLGLAYVYAESAHDMIEAGKLVPLLKGQTPELPQYTINYLTKRHMPARLRAFIDLAKQSDRAGAFSRGITKGTEATS